MSSLHIIKAKSITIKQVIILACLFGFLHASGCSIECTVTQQQCTICFQNCQGAYSYANCSQTVQTSVSLHTFQVIIYNQRECSEKCCGSQLQMYGNQKFEECHQDGLIWTIIIVVTMIIIVTFVCICCCFPNLREKIASCLCKKVMVKQTPHDLKLQKNLSNQSNSKAVKDNQIQSKIQLEQIQSTIRVKQNCQRCSKPISNASTQCGHHFDPKCLWEIINLQKEKCPICQETEMEPVTIWCMYCQKKLRDELVVTNIKKEDILYYQQLCCQQCLE